MSAAKREKKQIVTLPAARISSIMKSHPDVSTISADSVLVAARAAELFIAHLARQGMAMSVNGKSLDYHHLSTVVSDDPRLEFLKDMIPPKMKIHEYQEILAKVEERERELGRTVLVSEVKASQAEEEEEEDDEAEEMEEETEERVDGEDAEEAEVEEDEDDENEADGEDEEEEKEEENGVESEQDDENENEDDDEEEEAEDEEEEEEAEDEEEVVELSDSDS